MFQRLIQVVGLIALVLGACGTLTASEQAGTRLLFNAPAQQSQVFELTLSNESSKHTHAWLYLRDSEGKHKHALRLFDELLPGEVATQFLHLEELGFKVAPGDQFVVASEQLVSLNVQRLHERSYKRLAPLAVEKAGIAEVSRDPLGRFFIRNAVSNYDIGEAFGYSVAQDRLFQMDQFIRSARGTLAEVFGPDFLEQDILARTIGYSEEEIQELKEKNIL